MILSSSGSGGMEAAVRSVLKKSDSILVVDAGKFGDRFAQIAESYGIKTDRLKLEWGQAVSVEDLEKAVTKKTTAVLLQHSETSTGVLHPLEEISKWLKKNHPDCLLIVDAITSIGAMPFEMDAWNVDVAVTASQKALMLPPGLSFISLSNRAEKRMSESDLPGFYFQLKRDLEAIRKNQTAFSPAISLVFGLQESLRMIFDEGLESVFRRHRKLAESTRKALPLLGLKLATNSPTLACSAAFFPEGVDGKKLLKNIKAQTGFHIAGAQDFWEGKVVRVSHLGYYSPYDLIVCLTALGRELERAGAKAKTSESLQVFMDTYGL